MHSETLKSQLYFIHGIHFSTFVSSSGVWAELLTVHCTKVINKNCLS